jgi:hypothetical protein
MLTFDERDLGGNLLQQSGSGSELDPEPNRGFAPVAINNPGLIWIVTGCGWIAGDG